MVIYTYLATKIHAAGFSFFLAVAAVAVVFDDAITIMKKNVVILVNLS
jgi:hypothetical protein